MLHRCARDLTERKVQNVRVGSGGVSYLWPGVPKTSSAGLGFITKIGWTIREESYDMVADLDALTAEQISSFVTHDVHELMEPEVHDLLNLLEESFPSWREPYELAIAEGCFSDVSVAVSPEGELAGCVLAFTNADKNYDNGLAWRGVLGARMGGFAVLGVKESLRGRGIGLSLAAKVTLDLKLRGVTKSLAGYTYLEDLYGKIGYRVWRRWAMTNGLSPENILHTTHITKLLDR